MPERNADQDASRDSNLGASRPDGQVSDAGARVGKTHRPKYETLIDDESDEFEAYDQRRR